MPFKKTGHMTITEGFGLHAVLILLFVGLAFHVPPAVASIATIRVLSRHAFDPGFLIQTGGPANGELLPGAAKCTVPPSRSIAIS